MKSAGTSRKGCGAGFLEAEKELVVVNDQTPGSCRFLECGVESSVDRLQFCEASSWEVLE